MTDAPLVGVDLGGTNMQIGVVSNDGKVLSRAKNRTKATEGRDAVLDRIASGVREACEEAKVSLADIAAVGLGVPGPVNPNTGILFEAVNLGWKDEPIADLMKERLEGRTVVLDNDVNVAVWGEYLHGSGKGATDLLGAWVGTGVGGALILNGSMHYGHFFTAGEIGHVLVDPDNPPGVRSLEHNCSRTALCHRARQLIEAGRESIIPRLVDGKLDKIKSKVLAQAYQDDDELTIEIIHDAADRLGVTLGGFVTALSLDRIVLGGGLTEAIGEPFVELVRAATHRVAFPGVCRQVKVVASELEDNAGVVGAAMLAKARVGA